MEPNSEIQKGNPPPLLELDKRALESHLLFTKYYEKHLSKLAEEHPTLGILKIDELNPKESKHPNALSIHRIEFTDHSKIALRYQLENPDKELGLLKLPKLPSLKKGKPEKPKPFLIAEYRILEFDSRPNYFRLKQINESLSPILSHLKTDFKPSSLDNLVLGQTFVKKSESSVIPVKLGISDANELTAYISQPLHFFWDDWGALQEFGGYLALWTRSLKRVIPEVHKIATELVYK